MGLTLEKFDKLHDKIREIAAKVNSKREDLSVIRVYKYEDSTPLRIDITSSNSNEREAVTTDPDSPRLEKEVEGKIKKVLEKKNIGIEGN